MAVFQEVVCLQKCQRDYVKETKKKQTKNLRKGVPLLAPFPGSGHSRLLVFL